MLENPCSNKAINVLLICSFLTFSPAGYISKGVYLMNFPIFIDTISLGQVEFSKLVV